MELCSEATVSTCALGYCLGSEVIQSRVLGALTECNSSEVQDMPMH
jgi:hypothetical protein